MHGTILLNTPLPLWTSIITLGKKNDDEKSLFGFTYDRRFFNDKSESEYQDDI